MPEMPEHYRREFGSLDRRLAEATTPEEIAELEAWRDEAWTYFTETYGEAA